MFAQESYRLYEAGFSGSYGWRFLGPVMSGQTSLHDLMPNSSSQKMATRCFISGFEDVMFKRVKRTSSCQLPSLLPAGSWRQERTHGLGWVDLSCFV